MSIVFDHVRNDQNERYELDHVRNDQCNVTSSDDVNHVRNDSL